jgi:putative acetyltransferase
VRDPVCESTAGFDAPPEGFDLRPAADSDASGIIALYSACWSEHEGMILDTVGEMVHLNHVASHYERAGGAAWVIERSGGSRSADAGSTAISASVAWRPIGDERANDGGSPYSELQMLYVMPEARRMGIASYLVRMVENHVARIGVEELELWSDIRFTDAHRLYRSLGWRQLDETRHVDDLSDSTEYHFVKKLTRNFAG